jgi:hypothetical protein
MREFMNREAGLLPCFAAITLVIGFFMLVIA